MASMDEVELAEVRRLNASADQAVVKLRAALDSHEDQGQVGEGHVCTIHPHASGAVATCTCGWKGIVRRNRNEAEREAEAHRASVTAAPAGAEEGSRRAGAVECDGSGGPHLIVSDEAFEAATKAAHAWLLRVYGGCEWEDLDPLARPYSLVSEVARFLCPRCQPVEGGRPELELGDPDRKRLIEIADIIGAVHAPDADPRFHEDDARLIRRLASNVPDPQVEQGEPDYDELARKVLERFQPTHAVFDMPGGATQEANWPEIVAQILYYADQSRSGDSTQQPTTPSDPQGAGGEEALADVIADLELRIAGERQLAVSDLLPGLEAALEQIESPSHGGEEGVKQERIAELERALRDVRFHTGRGEARDGTILEIRETVDRTLGDSPAPGGDGSE
jgi:hypothetical protein